MRAFWLIFLTLLVISSVGVLAEDMLSETATETTLDGKIETGEYSFSKSFKNGELKLYLNRNGTTLSVGVEAKTNGWVAAGFGSDRMSNAKILIGYVKGGEAALRFDSGQGHSHKKADDKDLKGYTLSEAGDQTVLEAQLNASAFIKSGQGELKLITAYGKPDSFRPIHRFRTGFSVKLSR